MISAPFTIGGKVEPTLRPSSIFSPFVARDPENGSVVDQAKGSGLASFQAFLDEFERRAETNPLFRGSFEHHQKQQDFLKHALGEIQREPMMHSSPFLTERFADIVQELSKLAAEKPQTAYRLFQGALRQHLYELSNGNGKANHALPLNEASTRQVKLSQELLTRHFVDDGSMLVSFDPMHYRYAGREAAEAQIEMLSQFPVLDHEQKRLVDHHLRYDEATFPLAFILHSGPGRNGESPAIKHSPGSEGTVLDAPALKALAYAKYGLKLVEQGEKEKAASEVYPLVQSYLSEIFPLEGRVVFWDGAAAPEDSADLKSLGASPSLWGNEIIDLKERPSYDLWEKVKAKRHFWNDMAMAAAFTKGGLLAKALGKEAESAEYLKTAMKLSEISLNGIFMEDNEHRVIYPDRDVMSRRGEKHPYLDMAVIGGLLLGKEAGYPVALDHPYALHTLTSLVDTFRVRYPINAGLPREEGVWMGRFPGDEHPSVQTTAWTGQYFYELARKYVEGKEIELTYGRKADLEKLLEISLPDTPVLLQSSSYYNYNYKEVILKLIQRGDAELQRILNHVQDGWLSESVHRETGKPHSAVDFAASHAAFLSAMRAREELFAAALAQEEPVIVPALHTV